MQLNPQSRELDDAVLAIAKALFGKTPRLEKCHSQVNYCVVLSFDDATADRVIKLTHRYRWAIEVERHLYPAMRERGLPVPEVEFTQRDYAEPSEPFIVMPKFSDHTLDDLCENGHRAAVRACEASGRFIHDLHEQFDEAFEPLRSIEECRGQLAAIQAQYDQEQDLSPIWDREPALCRIVETHMATFRRTPIKRLTHGQLHTQNILADQGGEICIVDFGESIGRSSPLRDLCLLLRAHDGWESGTGNPQQRKALLRGYGRIDDEDILELRYWEFRDAVKSLCDYIQIDPNSELVQRMITKVRTIADGRSLLPLL